MKFTQFCLAALLTFTGFTAIGQDLEHALEGAKTFPEIRDRAEAYFAQHPPLMRQGAGADDNEYTRYRRYAHFWEGRVLPDGNFPDLVKQWELYKDYQQGRTRGKKRSGAWRNISQTTTTSGYEGMGRLAAVSFHPTDSNVIYVGVNKGGIWRTVNGGQTWTPLGDQLPWCSVGNIVVDKVNPSTLYITIGLNESSSHYGLGVYKSTDNGMTWNATPQSGYFTDYVVYYKLMAHPDSNQVLYSCQSDGLWKTGDGGNTWVKLRNGLHRDMEFKPSHPATFYVAGANEIYRSTDRGLTFTALTTFGTATNMELTVTPADSNYVAFATASTKDFYLSTDGGNTPFVLKNDNIDDNEVVQFSHLNKNRVYLGYVTNWRSTNAGTSWTKITNWYNDGVLPAVHADNHYAAVNPLLPHCIYFCNDGGLYRYNELANQWTDLSNGLIITEFYRIAVSSQDSVFMIGGTQDNGGRKRLTPSSWGATNGGDGMEVAVNPVDDQTIYTTYWGGTLYRSYDQWVNDKYTEITPDSVKAAWVTPYMLDPNNASVLVGGYADVWRSVDEGSNWTKISNNLTGNPNTKLKFLDVARANSNVIYTGYDEELYVTTNLGANWTNRQIPDSSGTFENATMLLSHPKNASVIFVTKSGYGAKSKVYRSADGGQTWVNISYNLPNVPANCVQIDRESDSSNVDIYVGTDIGVFYKKDSDMTWQYFGTGLPNTQVSDIEIYYPTGKLRAGTYGRGIWENNIARVITPLGIGATEQAQQQVQLRGNPVQQELVLEMAGGLKGKALLQIRDASGRVIRSEWLQSGMQTFNVSVGALSAGIYFADLRFEGGQQQTLRFWKD